MLWTVWGIKGRVEEECSPGMQTSGLRKQNNNNEKPNKQKAKQNKTPPNQTRGAQGLWSAAVFMSGSEWASQGITTVIWEEFFLSEIFEEQRLYFVPFHIEWEELTSCNQRFLSDSCRICHSLIIGLLLGRGGIFCSQLLPRAQSFGILTDIASSSPTPSFRVNILLVFEVNSCYVAPAHNPSSASQRLEL